MNKIEALEKTIYNLENDVYEYNWNNFERCNCGILAQSVVGDKTLRDSGYRDSPSVQGSGASAMFHCLTTGLPLPEIYKTMKSAGFTYEEMANLEILGGESILKKAGMSRYGHKIDSKPDLTRYLKAWVELLKEEQPVVTIPEPKIKEIIRYVSVPQSITEQSKELILS
jgi:hypothetical protein